MLKIPPLILLWVAFTAGVCLAQNSPTKIKEDFKPSSKNQPGKAYPQVNSQGYARFRVEAPEAKSVVVSLGLEGKGGTNPPPIAGDHEEPESSVLKYVLLLDNLEVQADCPISFTH